MSHFHAMLLFSSLSRVFSKRYAAIYFWLFRTTWPAAGAAGKKDQPWGSWPASEWKRRQWIFKLVSAPAPRQREALRFLPGRRSPLLPAAARRTANAGLAVVAAGKKDQPWGSWPASEWEKEAVDFQASTRWLSCARGGPAEGIRPSTPRTVCRARRTGYGGGGKPHSWRLLSLSEESWLRYSRMHFDGHSICWKKKDFSLVLFFFGEFPKLAAF